MILEFRDGTQMDVLVVYGESRICNSSKYTTLIDRDVLSIHVDSNLYGIDQLTSIFTEDRCKEIYLYTSEIDQSGQEVAMQNKVGDGYCLILSINETQQLKSSPIGEIVKPEYDNITIIEIAQLTYDEWNGVL